MIGSAALMIAALGILIACGVQVAVALGAVSIASIYFATGEWQAVSRIIASVAYDGLRNEALLTVPLLSLMSVFIVRSRAATDVFWAATRALRAHPGAAPLAAIIGMALHAWSSGGSTPAVANFARVAHPELKRRGYDRAFALGMLANASVLGALLPPGVLLVLWGLLGQQPVNAILLAAVTPAVIIIVCLVTSVVAVTRGTQTPHTGKMSARPAQALGSIIGLIAIFVGVLGGIASRLLSPAEAAGVGAAIALVMALRKGMRIPGIVEAVLLAGRIAAPILLLLLMALLYGQALMVTGAGASIQGWLGSLNPALGLGLMIFIWLLLATMLDSMAVLALTVALFAPAARMLGIDPLVFAVIGVVVVEAAQIIPPFGLVVFSVRAATAEDGVGLFDIFRFVLPLVAILLTVIVLIAAFPKIAVWLPYMVGQAL